MQAFVLALVLVLAALPALAAPAVGHVAWTHEDNAFFTTAQVVHGPAPSVIVGAGHRNAFYASCVPGNPSPHLNGLHDSSTPPEAKLVALDATTGQARWQVAMSEEVGPAAERERFVLLFQSLLDDVDGDGQLDLLTVTGEYDASRSSSTPVVMNPKPSNGTTTITMRDPTTGVARWEESWPVPDGHFEMIDVKPVVLGGSPKAIVVSALVTYVGGYRIDSTTRLVAFDQAGSVTPVASLPAEPNTLTTSSVLAGPDGATLVLSHVRLQEHNGTNHAVDFRAYDVSAQPDDGAALHARWERRGAGGQATGPFPAFLTDDAEPKLITAQGHDGRPGMLNGVAAYDLATGTELWRAPVYVGQGVGPLTVADVNDDGIADAVGGMMGDVAGVPTLPPAPQIVAVDGRTGDILWRRVDAMGKFRPLTLGTVDLDGDGRTHVVATLVQRDGTTCGSAQDEPGAIGVYDGATGAQQCRFPTDRPVWSVAAVDVPEQTGQTLVAPALGGTVYGFRNAQPGCGVMAAGP
jgi:outer membrane protein assembly factor BamB